MSEKERIEKIRKWGAIQTRHFMRLKRKTGLNFSVTIFDFKMGEGERTFCQMFNSFAFPESFKPQFKEIISHQIDSCCTGLSNEVYSEEFKDEYFLRLREIQSKREQYEKHEFIRYLAYLILFELKDEGGFFARFIRKIIMKRFKK